MKIELIVSDICVIPSLTKEGESIRVSIGVQHDFDDILDLCAGKLSNDEIAFIYRLWGDDEFPRTFERIGPDLKITATEI